MTHANDDWPQPYAIRVGWFDAMPIDISSPAEMMAWAWCQQQAHRACPPDDSQLDDAWGIVANVSEADRALRHGAKVWLTLGMSYDRYKVSGLARGGRRTEKIVPIRRLANYRPKWIPPELRDLVHVQFATKEAAEERCAYIAGEVATMLAKSPYSGWVPGS